MPIDDHPEPPDLDLIRMVQNARMQNDASAVPSQVSGAYWVEAKPETPRQTPTTRAGRWVIQTTAHEVDALWVTIRDATQAGRLGYKSKVTTASRTAGPNDADRVVFVLTYDADDSADVARVRAALNDLGVRPTGYERVSEHHKPSP